LTDQNRARCARRTGTRNHVHDCDYAIPHGGGIHTPKNAKIRAAGRIARDRLSATNRNRPGAHVDGEEICGIIAQSKLKAGRLSYGRRTG
jgi:hypothetical protein